MSVSASEFHVLCQQVVGTALEEFGLVGHGLRDAHPFSPTVEFLSSLSFCNVMWERRDRELIIFVGMLRDSEVPPYSDWDVNYGARNWLNLESLLECRASSGPAWTGQLVEEEPAAIKDVLSRACVHMEECEDVLLGNGGPALDRLVECIDKLQRQRLRNWRSKSDWDPS